MVDIQDIEIEDHNHNDYKSSAEGKPVSIKTLKFMITRLEEDMERNVRAMSQVRRELEAIIEELGETW